MNIQEYERLKNINQESDLIHVQWLDQRDRTLLYGYTCNRDTWHLYLKDGVIHKVVYYYPDLLITHESYIESISVYDASPDKRLYPSACDYQFCELMTRYGGYLPFTVWDDREPLQFEGKLIEELKVKEEKL